MRVSLLWVAFVSTACDDHLFLPPDDGGPVGEGWCAAQSLFASTCDGCHSAANPLGGLDLETDPHAAIVGVTSATYGVVLVASGDPDGSLLQRKLEHTQAPDEGTEMPPGGGVSEERIAAVRQWIADGASDVCENGTTSTYHPPGWADPGEHGLATKLGEQDCRTCHGPELDGGSVAVSCHTCHPAEWTTTCTFCHGDETTGVAAPPEDIDDNDDPATITFPPHLLHLDSTMHATWDCDQCHVKPTSALDPSHVFDDASPALAELVFTSGLSPTATYANGTCSASYCHGNGRGPNGTVSVGDDVACGDCHGVSGGWGTMSGEHEKHLDEDLQCSECHPDVSSAEQITDKAAHVDGDVDIRLPPTMSFGATCTGTCHGESHTGETWTGGDDD